MELKCVTLKQADIIKKELLQVYETQIRHLLALKLQIHSENQIRLQSICVHSTEHSLSNFDVFPLKRPISNDNVMRDCRLFMSSSNAEWIIDN
jgi:hypothetical protein